MLYFINSYLNGRKQRTKRNSSYSVLAEILFGVPQGSILGPLPLTFTSATFFLKIVTLILLIMLMTTRMPVRQILILSFLNFGKNIKRIKLLGIHINNILNFDHHVNELFKKAIKKLHALVLLRTWTLISWGYSWRLLYLHSFLIAF